MMRLSIDQLQEISAKTNLGMKAFVNKEIGKIFLIPDPDSIHTSEEFIEDELKEIYHQWNSYFTIESVPESLELKWMREFTNSLKNEETKQELISLLDAENGYELFINQLKTSALIIEWEEYLPLREIEYQKNIYTQNEIMISESGLSDFIMHY